MGNRLARRARETGQRVQMTTPLLLLLLAYVVLTLVGVGVTLWQWWAFGMSAARWLRSLYRCDRTRAGDQFLEGIVACVFVAAIVVSVGLSILQDRAIAQEEMTHARRHAVSDTRCVRVPFSRATWREKYQATTPATAPLAVNPTAITPDQNAHSSVLDTFLLVFTIAVGFVILSCATFVIAVMTREFNRKR
jgi:hypothetical protein